MSKNGLRFVTDDFLNSEAALIALEELDKDAFEQDDAHDRDAALKTFKANRDGCMCYMMLTMRPFGNYEWRLRKYPPFLLDCPDEAIALDRREGLGPRR